MAPAKSSGTKAPKKGQDATGLKAQKQKAAKVVNGAPTKKAKGSRAEPAVQLAPGISTQATCRGGNPAVAPRPRVDEGAWSSRQPVYSEESMEFSSTGSEEEEEWKRSHGSRTRRRRTSKHRCSRKHHDTSYSSELSSDKDSAQADGFYWVSREGIPSLPPPLAKCHDLSLGLPQDGTDHDSVMSNGELLQDPPGWHLPKKVKERALDGYYVDIFILLG
uniref:Uncharacterized protein n=1 Tax=Sphaerodactylus townsendi TaxID=933632 RepID=A0ACB8ERJ7_9SAUR